MTDRELLELAAKAAGDEVFGEPGCYFRRLHAGHVTGWNPLADDGDALRLAVKLNLHIAIECESAGSVTAEWGMGDGAFPEHNIEELAPVGGDDCAATRRAIVRAAAEIGKGQP